LERLPIGDIEDFALGFKQEGTKLFLFGKADKRLFAFLHQKCGTGL
jgi:hypothetical protein